MTHPYSSKFIARKYIYYLNLLNNLFIKFLIYVYVLYDFGGKTDFKSKDFILNLFVKNLILHIQRRPKNFFLGCVISPLRQQAESRNLGRFFANSVWRPRRRLSIPARQVFNTHIDHYAPQTCSYSCSLSETGFDRAMCHSPIVIDVRVSWLQTNVPAMLVVPQDIPIEIHGTFWV